MTDRPRRRTAMGVLLPLALSLLAVACLPDAVGPGSSPGSRPPATPTARPTPSGPTPVPTFVPPTPTPGPTFMNYVVVRGDSLIKIAKRFKTTDRSIAFWNRARYPSLDPESDKYSPNRIEVGWSLAVIPGAVVDEQHLPEPAPTLEPSPTLEETPSAASTP